MASILLLVPLADFDGHMDWDGGWGILMVLGMLLFWALIIGAVVWLVKELSGNGKRLHPAGPEADPLKILDRRLAEGAISPDDYRERRAILSGDQAPPES